MTWGGFKQFVADHDVKDSDPIWYIDISLPEIENAMKEPAVVFDTQLGVGISN
jgi:hypothetical protein